MEEDRVNFLTDQEEFKRSHRASWEIDVKEKQRLIALAGDKAAFEEAVKTRRAADFAALQARRLRCCRLSASNAVACLSQLHLEACTPAAAAQSQLGHSSLRGKLHSRIVGVFAVQRSAWACHNRAQWGLHTVERERQRQRQSEQQMQRQCKYLTDCRKETEEDHEQHVNHR